LRLKDEFLANVSHDLRTPLQALGMTAEMLHAQHYGPLNERQAMALERMQANLGYLGDLVNDVLDLAKLQSGKFKLHMDRVRLAEAAQASMRLVEPLAVAKRQQLQLKALADVPEVEADPQRLQQI
ncbi:MAG: HAMP domain-containing histidine kinase, partial [Caldilineaceae bacterium]|nr:HAMP domain-containing histidine kinase [Caldilineaceae bacterium]